MTKAKGRTKICTIRMTPELHRRVVHASKENMTAWVCSVLEQFLDERGIWPPGEGPPELPRETAAAPWPGNLQ